MSSGPQRHPLEEAVEELAARGEPSARLGLDAGRAEAPQYRLPSGSYGELAWEWNGTAQGVFAGRGPKGWSRSDDRIREEVCEALTREADLDPSDVRVTVEEGEVTLEGTVPDRRSKRRAEDLADRRGVRDVHNRLRVQKGA